MKDVFMGLSCFFVLRCFWYAAIPLITIVIWILSRFYFHTWMMKCFYALSFLVHNCIILCIFRTHSVSQVAQSYILYGRGKVVWSNGRFSFFLDNFGGEILKPVNHKTESHLFLWYSNTLESWSQWKTFLKGGWYCSNNNGLAKPWLTLLLV